jgi:hypothetical protein
MRARTTAKLGGWTGVALVLGLLPVAPAIGQDRAEERE